jgi:hypothetical protein
MPNHTPDRMEVESPQRGLEARATTESGIYIRGPGASLAQVAARWNACADALALLSRDDVDPRESAWAAETLLRAALDGSHHDTARSTT